MTMIARARAHPPLIAHEILTATVVLLGMITVACSEDPTLAGLVREPPPDVGGIILPDVANGSAPFATTAQEGQILVVYFGYTSWARHLPHDACRSATGGRGARR